MQTYVIGIGQCGSSITLDVISTLTGFTKSKQISATPSVGASQKATNELLERFRSDYNDRGLFRRWMMEVRRRIERAGDDGDVFVDPEFAIIDGNEDNYVKNAFELFRGDLTMEDCASDDFTKRQRYLAGLILDTTVFDLSNHGNGCAHGIVGEAVTSSSLRATALQSRLGVTNAGLAKSDDGRTSRLPVRIFFVVASAGGGTGSGGSAYLAGNGTILHHAKAKMDSIVANVVVLPSVQASNSNPPYALNTGRLLARSAGVIRLADSNPDERNFSTILFSNPPHEGDSKELQLLNDYIVEFMKRCSNFSFPANVARIARDCDPRELCNYLRGKCSVLAMNALEWEGDSDEFEEALVRPAFSDIYESGKGGRSQKPFGLSVERDIDAPNGGSEHTVNVLKTTTNVAVVIGIPKNFDGPLDLARIEELIRDGSGAPLRGVRFYSYGSLEEVEITMMFRFRRMEDNPLAAHFVAKYACDARSQYGEPIEAEADYIQRMAAGGSEFAEEFEEIGFSRDITKGFDRCIIDHDRASGFCP